MLEYWVKRLEIDIGSKEFFKLAKMDMHEAHNYIIKKYGRNEANYFDKYMIPRYSNMKIAYESEFR
jgi:hypothetical protein